MTGLSTLLLVSALFFSAGSASWVRDRQAASSAGQETPEQPAIQSPAGGEALQGVVAISGTSAVPGFLSAEVAFAYQEDPTGTWFVIQHSTQPVTEGPLASWDTTTISDGSYRLRLRVVQADGQVLEAVVAGLRVRNYTRVETATPPARAARQATATPTPPPAADYQPQSGDRAPAPTNPAQVTTEDIRRGAQRGALLAFSMLLVGMLYTGVRALLRR